MFSIKVELNSDLATEHTNNLNELCSRFQTHNNVVISPILQNQDAEKIYKEFCDTPDDAWDVQSCINNNKLQLRNKPENEEKIRERFCFALENAHNFSFNFCRISNNDILHFKLMVDFCQSLPFCQLLERVTQKSVSRVKSPFSAMYRPLDFLSLHNDQKLGELGLTFYFTKNWNPIYGGLLHFVHDEFHDIIEATKVPKFNSLTIFDIKNGQGKFHFVSQVLFACPQKRYSFSCWMD